MCPSKNRWRKPCSSDAARRGESGRSPFRSRGFLRCATRPPRVPRFGMVPPRQPRTFSV
ncbi:hypothetical protein THTE_0303 [Thermogutta terrifontis]|uniref:Uncharacterized protein n=1 Tax=Thermogutta terrifontis TaxID=1331910 RepID=A0A286RAA2_9BACT|nr:hypothetical protein THTE_0303 [Thermogutta terrifontis]